MQQQGAGVRIVVEDHLRRAGVRPERLNIVMEMGLMESAKQAAIAGGGVTFLSRWAIGPEVEHGTLARGADRGLPGAARLLHRALQDPRAEPGRRGAARVLPRAVRGGRLTLRRRAARRRAAPNAAAPCIACRVLLRYSAESSLIRGLRPGFRPGKGVGPWIARTTHCGGSSPPAIPAGL